MIIYALMLTLGLDMSLPEFQPEKDLSGNYIVGTYDVSSGDVYVETLDTIPVGDNSSVDDSLSTSPVRIETLSVSGNDDVVSAIEQFNADNNAYWEQFIADYESNYFKKNVGTFVSPNPFWIGSTGGITSQSVNTYKFVYCEVKKGHTYTLNGVLFPLSSGSGTYRSGFVPDLTEHGLSVISFHNFYSNNPNGYTFTAPINGYYCLCVNSTDTFRGFNLIETLTYREDITEIRSEMNMKFRVLIFLTLMSLVYPIVCSISKNIIGGDK